MRGVGKDYLVAMGGLAPNVVETTQCCCSDGEGCRFLRDVDTVPHSSIPVSSVHLQQLVEHIPMHGKGEMAPFVVLMQTHALWGEDTPQPAENPLNIHTMHGCGKRNQGCPRQNGQLVTPCHPPPEQIKVVFLPRHITAHGEVQGPFPICCGLQLR